MYRIVNKGFKRRSVSICSSKPAIVPEVTHVSSDASPAPSVDSSKLHACAKSHRKKTYPRQETFNDTSQSTSDSPFDLSACQVCGARIEADPSQFLARCGHKTGICEACWTRSGLSFRCHVCLGLYCTTKCMVENSACRHTSCSRCSFQCKICSERSCVACLVRCSECCTAVCGRCVAGCYRCKKPVCVGCRIVRHRTGDKFLCEACLTDIPQSSDGGWIKFSATRTRKALFACADAIAFTEEGAFAGKIDLKNATVT